MIAIEWLCFERIKVVAEGSFKWQFKSVLQTYGKEGGHGQNAKQKASVGNSCYIYTSYSNRNVLKESEIC